MVVAVTAREVDIGAAGEVWDVRCPGEMSEVDGERAYLLEGGMRVAEGFPCRVKVAVGG